MTSAAEIARGLSKEESPTRHGEPPRMTPSPTPAAAIAGRHGDWIQTFSGLQFWPLDPRPEDVCIEDIAHSLAMKCRYGGHCLTFYSVAEHSVLLSRAVTPEHAMWALLHDAGEAYLADIPKPVKPSIQEWKDIERRVMDAVCDRFGLDRAEPGAVKTADFAILADEKVALMADGPAWSRLPDPLGVAIEAWSPATAKANFLARFHEIRAALQQQEPGDGR